MDKKKDTILGTIFIVIIPLVIAAFAVGTTLFSHKGIIRTFGGNDTIMVDKGYKLNMVTWKGNDLWVLTEPMDSTYIPKSKVFKENSNLGIFEGSIVFIENK